MRSLIIALALALATSASAGAPHCTKGVPCGNACIAKGKVCHVGQSGAASASGAGVPAAATASAAAPAGKAPPTCKAGTKLCGKACIPAAKTCHK